MTVIRHTSGHSKRAKYKCDICKKIDFWGDGWSRYSSIALDDECPNDVPAACSDKCFDEVVRKIKCREFVLPVLGQFNGGYYNITKPRKGY